ncbi:MAG TPA: Hpt domain-containing protein [Gammaproteobacteria bacterium]|nr:Hpt domain-containing protein [Gammaproteobacteria bacterium]
MSQTAMDAAAFTEMKELMGDTFTEIINMCLQSLPEQLAGIETAISENNAEHLFNISHKMKSSCGSIGAFGLAKKAEAIEIIGRDGSTDISAQLIDELRDLTHQVVSILNAELK